MNRYEGYYKEVKDLKRNIEHYQPGPDGIVCISLRFPKNDILEILGFMELYFKGAADWESEQNQTIE